MSEEFQKHLFNVFEQEDSGVGAQQGTGLGLSIVKQLLTLMKGTISINSAPSVGTTVHIHLDMLLAENVPQEKTETSVELELLSGKHVLLAEDHPLNQKIAVRLLEKVGILTHVVTNGQDSVKAFLEQPICMMPFYWTFVCRLWMDWRPQKRSVPVGVPNAEHIPLIALSANAYMEDIQKALEKGMNAHLAKPIESNALYKTLSKLIKNKEVG